MSQAYWIGQTLGGRYRVEELLGQGGMSAVYKAFDPNLKRVVAIKLIHSHLAEDPKFVLRFEEEATAVAQLRHPNIVQVFDYNHDGSVAYMVQEFVAGETLQSRMQRLQQQGSRMDIAEAIGYIIEICQATGYAHKRGMIHRDIKPANIMLDVHGQAILMDFGIVKIVGSQGHTASGAVMGTAVYMPPELIRGEAPSPASDIYSLGVTLFEMLGGRPPYQAESAMTLLMMHLNDPVPELRGLRIEVPEFLQAIVAKALAKNRNERFASMEEFAAALTRALDLLAGPSQPGVVNPAAQTLSMGSLPGAESAAQPAGNSFSTVPLATDGPGMRAVSNTPAPTPTGERDAAGGYVPGQNGGKRIPGWVWAGAGGLGLVILVVLAYVIFSSFNKPAVNGLQAIAQYATETQKANLENAAALQAATTEAVVNASPSETNTPEPTPSATPSPTVTETPTATLSPTPAASPTPTVPVGVSYARIRGITVSNNGRYIVNYETFEYTENLPGPHVHFFFNTVPVDQAGVPGKGPWYLYGGPRPFEKALQKDRPENATQLCILVANSDHSVILNSGNCFILPDVTVAAPRADVACLSGPGEQYPASDIVKAGEVTKVQGISVDEEWWVVKSPLKPERECWLQRSESDFVGDISQLPVIDAPEVSNLPTEVPASVELTGISINNQNAYAVEFKTFGFLPQLPGGKHLHFFFDTELANASEALTYNLLMSGGESPFTGFLVSDRPEKATKMCVVIANPDHTILTDTIKCIDLP